MADRTHHRCARPQAVTDDVRALDLEVIEKPAPAADELEKTAAAVMVLRVRLEMLGEVGNSVREKRDLHFRRTGIAVVRAILGNQVRFFLFGGRQNPVSYTGLSVPSSVRSGTITAPSRKNNPATG